jgi:hypothetical protein
LVLAPRQVAAYALPVDVPAPVGSQWQITLDDDFKASAISTWDSTKIAPGTHTLTVIASDATGVHSPTGVPILISTSAPSVIKANRFLNSLGVGTKIIQGDSTATTIAGFQYLGIRNGRDDATHNTSAVANLCRVHAATGVMFDELPVVDASPNNLTETKAEWEQLAGCGAMGAAEGPNEPNNFGFTADNGQACNGNTYVGCASYMTALYNLLHSDPSLPAGMQLWGMTDVGYEPENDGLQFLTVPANSGSLAATGTIFADVATTHNYVQGNGSAGVSLVDNQARLAETVANGPWDTIGEYWGTTWSKGYAGGSTGQNDRPKVTTETGWNVYAKGSTITRDMQGKLIVDLWLDAYQLGWQKTFVYQMFERPPNDEGYGFLNADEATPVDLTPTAMGLYTHNLTTILADTPSAFTPTAISYTVTGMPSTGYRMLLQKSNGTYELALWGEAFAHKTSTPITVNLGSNYATINVYDVTSGSAPVMTLRNVGTVPLTLTDHPLIVEFGGRA